MPLTTQQRDLLVTAICETFDEPAFVEFARQHFSIDVYEYANQGQPFQTVTLHFVRHIEFEERVERLLTLLTIERPDELRFRELASQLTAQTSSPAGNAQSSLSLRWYSNLASSNRGEITVLAIIETVLSVALYVGIAIWFDTVRHIVVAAVLAPLWLLRTRGSMILGLRWYRRLEGQYGRAEQPVEPRKIESRFLLFVVAFIMGALFPVVVALVLVIFTFSIGVVCAIRVAAIGVSVIRHPLLHFVAIRKNWKRIVLATDVGTIPEWLPGVEQSSLMSHPNPPQISVTVLMRKFVYSNWTPRSTTWLSTITTPASIIVSLLLMRIWVVLLMYLVPLLLRTAVKGVSILYTPFFLVINSDPINRKLDLGTRLVEMQHDNTAILKRAFAFFAIGSFLLTILFSSLVMKAHEWIRPEATPVFVLLAEYYFPPTMKAWQLASAVNGALFLYLSWLYAPQAARRLEKGIWQPADVRTYLNRWIGVQMVLSIYSVMCAVAIFANFFLHHQFPARHWQWFPTVGM